MRRQNFLLLYPDAINLCQFGSIPRKYLKFSQILSLAFVVYTGFIIYMCDIHYYIENKNRCMFPIFTSEDIDDVFTAYCIIVFTT